MLDLNDPQAAAIFAAARIEDQNHRRFFRRVLAAVLFLLSPLASASAAEPGRVCPLCGGALTTVGKVSTRLAKPIRNCDVWGGVNCVNWGYQAKSLICTRCW